MTEMGDKPLGRLEKVEVRDQWANEQTSFTPWLAEQKNLDLLGDTLKLDLEAESVERQIGPFRADIVCKDVDSGSLVLIENQLEQTDHKHLGQLLTYAAGLQAVTIVWLASPFTDEHRAALDWLNGITQEEFRFFGLEIELWRIGDSPPAPKFNIVSRPNDWSRSTARAGRTDAELTEKRLKQKEYWAALQETLNAEGGPVAGDRDPKPRNWISYRIGRSGFHLAAVMNSTKSWIRAELYVSGSKATERFRNLEKQKETIEGKLGHPPKWEELPTKNASRIAYYLHNADPWNEEDWPRQHEWLAEHLNKIHEVFSERVKDL